MANKQSMVILGRNFPDLNVVGEYLMGANYPITI